MILRKPYAFFIKIFRPLHFLLAFCIGFLIAYQNKILTFLSNYLYTTELINTKNIRSETINSTIFIIPAVLIIFSLILFSIMFKKKKLCKFYIISIFVYIFILVIDTYAANLFGALEKTTVAIKTVKLVHDLVLINIISESILFLIYIIRGFGINFKKFDFSSDIAKLDISDEDKEEFELDIQFDFNETKRKRREKIRNLKYYYLEHKFIVNLSFSLFLTIIVIFITVLVIKRSNYNKEGKEYALNDFDLIVEETNLLNTNYEGSKITDNYLIVVKTKLKSSKTSKSLFLKDFNLKTENSVVAATKEYDKYLSDLGEQYQNQILTSDYNTYIFVYEIPYKYITSNMYLRYNNSGYDFDIKLNPKNIKTEKGTIKRKKTEDINFSKSLGDITFNINNYELEDYYRINYEYCINENDCFNSIEYLRPSIDENFDKAILKLDVEYSDDSKLDLYSFYDLLNSFGDLYYKKDGKWNVQSENFEEIISKKGENLYTYIGVNNDIKNADNIKFVFNIRGLKYEYTIK